MQSMNSAMCIISLAEPKPFLGIYKSAYGNEFNCEICKEELPKSHRTNDANGLRLEFD